MPVLSLGYLRLDATDLDAWKTFAGDFLGLMPVHADGDESLRYRMDHYPPRLVVSPGAEARATAIGFEVLNERDLKRVVAAVEDYGIKVTEGSDAEADERRVTGFARFDDPGGNPIELFYGPILDHKPVRTAAAGELLRDRRHGHGPRHRDRRGRQGAEGLLHRRARLLRAQHDGRPRAHGLVHELQRPAPHARRHLGARAAAG